MDCLWVLLPFLSVSSDAQVLGYVLQVLGLWLSWKFGASKP